MKRHLILLFVGVSLPFLLAAQQKNSVSITKRVLRIPEVTVVGKRPMKDIGVQRTRFDSIAMKENIALSMADVLIIQLIRFCQELRTRHVIHRGFPGYLSLAYPSDVEWYAH